MSTFETACRVSLGTAQQVVATRDQVLAAGRDEAQEMVRGATLERDGLVSDTEVFRVATRKAEETVAAGAEEPRRCCRRPTDTSRSGSRPSKAFWTPR